MKIYTEFSTEELQRMLTHCLSILEYQLRLISNKGEIIIEKDDKQMVAQVFPIVDCFIKCSLFMKTAGNTNLETYQDMYKSIKNNFEIKDGCKCHSEVWNEK